MINQYPHTAKFTITGSATQDPTTGNWIPGSTITFEKKCRAEPAGGNGIIKTSDGANVNFNWVVYFPLPVEKIAEGTVVEVTDEEGEIKLNDKVLRFNRGQLNARIWL